LRVFLYGKALIDPFSGWNLTTLEQNPCRWYSLEGVREDRSTGRNMPGAVQLSNVFNGKKGLKSAP